MRTQTDTSAGATGTAAERAAADVQRYRADAQRRQDAARFGTADLRLGCGHRAPAIPADGTGAPGCSRDLTPWCPPCLAEHVAGCPGCNS